MRKVITEFRPESFDRDLDLTDSREGTNHDFALLIVEVDLELLNVALEIELLVGPEAVVHRLDKLFGPGVSIGFSADLLFEYAVLVTHFLLIGEIGIALRQQQAYYTQPGV